MTNQGQGPSGQWPGWQPPPVQAWAPQPWTTPTATRPPAMSQAVMLLRLGAVLTVVGAVINVLLTDANNVGSSPFGGSSTTMDDSAVKAVTYVSAAITALVGVGLWLWMAWANGRGKSWARTVATVFACINGGFWMIGAVAVALIHTDYSGQSWAVRLIALAVSLATLVVGLYALWLMYRPESDAFYAATSDQPPPGAWSAYYPPGGYPYPYAYQPPPPASALPPPTPPPPPPPS